MLNLSAGTNRNHELKPRHIGECPEVLESISDLKIDRKNLLKALSDLHRLLEDYAPSWYTQEHRVHAEIALQGRK